jgi:hypothetical protein
MRCRSRRDKGALGIGRKAGMGVTIVGGLRFDVAGGEKCGVYKLIGLCVLLD